MTTPPTHMPETSGARAGGDRQRRVAELVARLTHYRETYYEGHPEISDAAFDALEDELTELAPDHPYFATIGAAPPVVSEWEKARHLLPMGSLNKATNETEFREWAARCDEIARQHGLPPVSPDLYVTEKLDGISLELVYVRGELKDGITRGDGEVGERITPNARRMRGVLPRLAEPLSVSVRGEIVLPISEWRAHFPEAANPRNAAAGTAKRFDGKNCDKLAVLCYDVEGPELATQAEKMELLARLGFLLPGRTRAGLDEVLALYREYGGEKRATLDHEIDGLVVQADAMAAFVALGDLHRRPRAAVAFKFASQAKVTTIADLRWETGPSGRIVPVAFVEPVQLAGATVRRASLHNAANVARLGIGVGDEALVSRRNDVIPYVEEVLRHAGRPAAPPTRCGVCDAPLVKEGEYLLCRNPDCRARTEGRIKAWIGALGLLEWGEKLVAQLVAERGVRQPADLYRLRVEDIAALERRGEKSAKKALDQLHEKRAVPLPTFLAGLGIESFSIQTARLLVSAGYDTLEKLEAATVEQLAEILGLGEIKARIVVEGVKDKHAVVRDLLAAGVAIAGAVPEGPLGGKSFCFTGAMRLPRGELHALVERYGGLVRTGVAKGLDYLVLADPASASTKAEKARKLGVRCISEEDFLAMLPDGVR